MTAPENSQETTQYLTLTSSFQDFFDNEQEISLRFRKPIKAAWDRYMADMGKGKLQQGQRNLLLACVHPEDKPGLITALDTHYALAASFATEIGKRMGLDSLGK